MYSKIENAKDIEFYSNFNALSEIIISAKNKKNSDKIYFMSKKLHEIFFYVNELQQNRMILKKSFSEYRQDKIRAIERARRSEEKIKQLEKEIKKLKQLSNL